MLWNRPRRAGGAFTSRIFASVSVAAMLAGCELPSIYEYWDSVVLSELEISPSFIALQEGQRASFAALGGKVPYRFELEGGGTLSPLSGARVEYFAPVGGPQEAQVRLRDAYDAVSAARVLVEASISLLSIAPTDAALLHGGFADFSFSGGKEPYSFSLEAGLGSVELTTATTGRYNAPAAADTDAMVRLEDASGQLADARIVVRAGAQPLVIIPSSVVMERGAAFTFAASGGAAPYLFNVATGVGSIDAGNGTYGSSSAGSAVVRVTDAVLSVADANVTVVEPAALPLVIVPRSVNIKMGASFQFEGEGGVPPYSFSMASGYGGYVDSQSGLYAAPSTKQGVERVQISDSRGISDAATVKVKK